VSKGKESNDEQGTQFKADNRLRKPAWQKIRKVAIRLPFNNYSGIN